MIQLVQTNAEKVDEMHKIKLLTDDIIRKMFMTLDVRMKTCSGFSKGYFRIRVVKG